MPKKFKYEVTVIVGMQDCGGDYDTAELEAIATVFSEAAKYARELDTKGAMAIDVGEVVCDTKQCPMLASVTLWPNNMELDFSKGETIPVIHRVHVAGREYKPKGANL